MTQEELDKIVEQHQHWLKEDCEGWENMRANLEGANLYADEDREKTEDMKPTAEAQTVLEKWLKDFGKDAVKAMKKVA